MTEFFGFLRHSINVNKLTKIDLEFGKALRKKRLLRKLTQEALSSASDLSRAYISELEMGHMDPSLYTLFKLSKALKINIRNLIHDFDVHI